MRFVKSLGVPDHPRAAGRWLGAGLLLDPLRRSRRRPARDQLRAGQGRVRHRGEGREPGLPEAAVSATRSQPRAGGFASRSLHAASASSGRAIPSPSRSPSCVAPPRRRARLRRRSPRPRPPAKRRVSMSPVPFGILPSMCGVSASKACSPSISAPMPLRRRDRGDQPAAACTSLPLRRHLRPSAAKQISVAREACELPQIAARQ